MNATPEDPSQTGGRTPTISIATWNIRDGRAGGLECAARALRVMHTHIVVVQGVKLSGRKHTRLLSGYAVMATDVKQARFGGVALLWEESELYELEEAKARGPNVITFELMTGTDRYYVVGCYIPPSDVAGTTLATIEQAMAEMPKGCIPILIEDLNANLTKPGDDRDEVDPRRWTQSTYHV